MAVTVGQIIGEAEYTALRNKMVTVMGTPAGTGTSATGYNQSTTAPSVSVGTTILASQWNALKDDLTKAYTHQTGAAPSSPALVTVTTSNQVTAAIHNDYETIADYIGDAANRFDLAAGQSTTTSARSRTATNWGQSPDTIIHDVEFTWTSANAVKAFFNAGGYIRMASSLAYTGSEAKTLQWKKMLDDSSVIAMNYNSAYKEVGTLGTINANDGYYDLNTTERTLYTQNNSNSPYSENQYRIRARAITNGVRIRLLYEDLDAGDQTGTGPAVDENVQGTLTSAFSYVRATGSNVQVDAPSIAVGSTNTFT
jgi:hypothetical protein